MTTLNIKLIRLFGHFLRHGNDIDCSSWATFLIPENLNI